MIILHLISAFFPVHNGTITRLYNLVSNLPYEIVVITSDRIKGGVIDPREEYFSNIRVKRVSLQSTGIYAIAPLRYIHAIYKEPKIIVNSAKPELFDIIHIHNPWSFGQAGEKLSKKCDKPLIFELHALPQEYTSGLKKTMVNALYTKRRTKNLLTSCNHIITLTQALKNWTLTRYKLPDDKITVVPNGVDINKFSPKEENNKKVSEIKEKLGLLDNVILYAGTIDKINGMIDLAKVVPSIIMKKPDTSFLFIGHGPEEDRIIRLSNKYPQVKFLSMVPYEDIHFYYQMCDLFVIPRPSTISVETLTPLKLLEAMAMEKVVLGSNVGGITEVIKHGKNGYLFKKGNMESFKSTLLGVLDAKNGQIGKNARKTIVENHTWDKSVMTLKKLYDELA